MNHFLTFLSRWKYTIGSFLLVLSVWIADLLIASRCKNPVFIIVGFIVCFLIVVFVPLGLEIDTYKQEEK